MRAEANRLRSQHNGHVADTRETQRTLDLALRIGETLLSNGAGAADVAATMTAIVRHFGLHRAQVDVTFTMLSLSHQETADDLPVVMRRSVQRRSTDFSAVCTANELLTRVLAGEIGRDDARAELAHMGVNPYGRPQWAITLGWGVSGAGIALLLGASWLVIAVAAFAGIGLEVGQRRIAPLNLPSFYVQAIGGMFGVAVAATLEVMDVAVSSTEIVSVSIVLLLAGLGFVGAIQDGLTGYYITANARILEVILSTAGILTGVSAGLAVTRALGMTIFVEPGQSGFAQLIGVVIGAAITSAAFAYTSLAPLRSLWATALIAALAATAYFVTAQAGFSRPGVAFVGAFVAGLGCFPLARMTRVPPLVLIVSAIVPLLPGLTILRALSQLSQNNLQGLLSLFTAAAVALALAAGAILGEYIAQPLERESRRLEDRLRGPRLVGPLRIIRRH